MLWCCVLVYSVVCCGVVYWSIVRYVVVCVLVYSAVCCGVVYWSIVWYVMVLCTRV